MNRALRSNIDNTDEFAEGVDYIPAKISFTAAGSDLLKLLVGPLYANEVYVGLRELIQNATDAVKELDSLVDQGAVHQPERRTDISSDVQVDFEINSESQNRWSRRVKSLCITDRGVGMNSDILQNYFLKAGASFRNSTAWKERFEKLDGASRVQRSGRFGVGALAAFLLGDQISVQTRRFSDSRQNGLKFTASVDTSSINVVKADLEVGTKIVIEVPDRLQSKVGSLLPATYDPKVSTSNGIGQYYGRYPELVYTVDGKKMSWDDKCLLPTRDSRFEGMWNFFETDNFEVNWTYSTGVVGLAVNQIRIQGKNPYSSRSSAAGVDLKSKIFSEPSLSIGDNDGSFQLNLQRSTYAGSDLPFLKELLREITDEYVFSCIWQLSVDQINDFPDYAGSISRVPENEPRWLDCSDGIILNEMRFLKQYNPEYLLNYYGSAPDAESFYKSICEFSGKYIYLNDSKFQRTYMKTTVSEKIIGKSINYVSKSGIDHNVFVSDIMLSDIMDTMKPGKGIISRIGLLSDDSVHGWKMKSGDDNMDTDIIRRWREEKKSSCSSVISIHRLSNQKVKIESGNDDIVFSRWMELIDQAYLPRSIDQLVELKSRLSRKLGEKYLIFERRAKDAESRKQAEKERQSVDS